MALLGDVRESTLKEKELIDTDLQKMGESLKLLKASVEKDATILEKTDFSDLLQHIVTDLSALSQTPDIVLLQQTLQSQENLTVSDLDKIIQHFISVKLEYTANKSLYLTDASLQKYKHLIDHKSDMDDLLLKISQTNAVPDTQDKETTPETTPTVPEVPDPVPEVVDSTVTNTQESSIDWQTGDAASHEGDSKEEKKSFWERAKESSFGLAYIFGAENMTTFKDWVWDKWDTFKEWIGWKKKEEKEETATPPEAPSTSSETPTPSVDINENLTEEERLLRNTYIKQSILDTTTVPVPIDYKIDKDLLLQKWSPNKISFDVDTQSIIIGGAKIQLKFPEFTMNVWGIDATVTKVDIRSIKTSGNDFIVEAKGTGSAWFLEQTKDISTTVSKEKFYALLQPYLETGSTTYDTSLEFDGQKVPLQLDVAWSIEPTSSVSEYDSQNMISYKNDIYNSYPEWERKYFDQLSKYSSDMYKNAATWLDKERLPALLQDYDADLLQWLDGGILAIVGKQFSTVSDLTNDTILWRAGNLANDILWTIVSFLETWEDSKILWWLAKILKWAPEKLQDMIPNGNEQKQKALRTAVEKQLRDDPAIKKDLEKIVKQFSLVRFYFTEKKALLQEKWSDTAHFDWLSLTAAADFLQKQSLLDTSISTKTTVWLEANRVSVALEDLIKKTNPDSDLSTERGKIVFNYKTNELESWSQRTKILVSKDGKQYKIDGLNMSFVDLKSVLWLANLSNRMIQQTGWLSWLASNWSDHFAYNSSFALTNWNRWWWLFVRDRWFIRTDTDKLVKDSTFEKYIQWWSVDNWKEYAAYLSKRLTIFGWSLFS